jgi:hypothetical protein
MATITVTDKAEKYIESLIDNAEREKSLIADALTTATESIHTLADEDEYLNICKLLGRYNRLISLIA